MELALYERLTPDGALATLAVAHGAGHFLLLLVVHLGIHGPAWAFPKGRGGGSGWCPGLLSLPAPRQLGPGPPSCVVWTALLGLISSREPSCHSSCSRGLPLPSTQGISPQHGLRVCCRQRAFYPHFPVTGIPGPAAPQVLAGLVGMPSHLTHGAAQPEGGPRSPGAWGYAFIKIPSPQRSGKG